MKVLKIIGIVIGSIIAIVLIIPLFVSNKYDVVRETTINKPNQAVFEYIKTSQNQKNYNIWWMKDPNSIKVSKGTEGTVGFVLAWDSKEKDAGKGEQEIKNIEEGKKVDFEIRFEEPMNSIVQSSMFTEAVSENQTKVKWSFSGNSPYPMNIMNLFIDNLCGSDMEKSMANLKTIMEK